MNVNELLRLMIKRGISDIHFKAGVPPAVRIDGRLIATGLDRFSADHIRELADALMTEDQRSVFAQENEIDIAYSVDSLSRFRVNVYRQRNSVALTLRVVPLEVKTIEELNLPAEPLRKLAAESRGLILISGVTGAGKTTTMNAMLDYINENYTYNIITVEDPIEYYHADKKSSVSQREVGTDTKSYARALKNILRQDPDVIVIGEMRDFEAVAAGITAAETGHLVISTIHTMDAVQTIDRIVNTYPPHQQGTIRAQLANVLKGIVAQRLVKCKSGEGRLPATEVLMGTSMVRKLLAEGKLSEVYKMMEQGSYYGMHTFDNNLFTLFREDRITIEEAMDKATNPDDLNLKLKGIERGE